MLSYLWGPLKDHWRGGEFVVHMIGLRFVVQFLAILSFVAQLWHEVDDVEGVQGSVVSYTKWFGRLDDKGHSIKVPDDLKWVSEKNFGLF